MEKAIKKIENEISKAKEEQKKLDEFDNDSYNRLKYHICGLEHAILILKDKQL